MRSLPDGERALQTPVLTTVYYHSVRREERAAFARQMDILLRYTVPVNTARDPLTIAARQNSALTFDDGFVSVAENALPELASRGIPSVLFIPTDFLGKAPGWLEERMLPDRDQLVLDAEGVRKSDSPLVTIGSHCARHVHLTKLSEREVMDELVRSKQILEDITGKTVDLLSFPHGAYNSRIIELARQAGYRRAFSVLPIFGSSVESDFLIGRISASPRDWPLEFYLKLMGDYVWLPYLKQEIKKVLQ